METFIERLPEIIDRIREIKETVLTNIVLLGQIPAPTFKEHRRSRFFLERLAELQVDECTTDGYRNPIGIIRGTNKECAPIFLAAHLDTSFSEDVDHNFVVDDRFITGAGVLDNSLGVGVLASIPVILKHLDIRLESDLVIAGVIQSLGRGNLRGIRHLLKTWSGPIRGGVILEGETLGRINYASDGMIRCEVECDASKSSLDRTSHFIPNAILILNELINEIMSIKLPQRPRARIIVGKIQGGIEHGLIARHAKLGLEIQSNSDDMVKAIFSEIQDMAEEIKHEYQVDLRLKVVSTIGAAKLRYNHPLVKRSLKIMKRLGVTPVSYPCESELSIFLSHRIPAVTLGLTNGINQHRIDARAEISHLFTGIAQVLGVLMAIDKGVCDEFRVD